MELTTERLVLREFVVEDWTAVLAYQQNPLYVRYYEWEERTAEQVRDFIQMFLDQQQETPRYKFQLAITLTESGQLIGNCGIRMKTAGATEADIGYELDPDCWGQGYATEAAAAILRFGFTQLDLHRVWATCLADNIGSVRVLEKLGMQLDVRLRDKEYFKGRWWDALRYAILDYEWESM